MVCEILNATRNRSNVTPQKDVKGTLNAIDKCCGLPSVGTDKVEEGKSAKFLVTGESKSRCGL
jgi:hypothetical protein